MTDGIVKWVIVDNRDGALAVYDTEREALSSACFVGKTKIIKLTGKMPEPKKMKKVASYLYMNDIGNVFQANQLVTEDVAEQECEKYKVELILWPYGDVIEVEEKHA